MLDCLHTPAGDCAHPFLRQVYVAVPKREVTSFTYPARDGVAPLSSKENEYEAVQ
jgi:hypothetical protein